MSWDINTLHIDLNTLKKINNKIILPSKKITCDKGILGLKKLIFFEKIKCMPYSKFSENIIQTYNIFLSAYTYKNIFDDSINIMQNIKKPNAPIIFPYDDFENINPHDLMHDFFKSTNVKLYNLFCKAEKRTCFNINENYENDFILIGALNKAYNNVSGETPEITYFNMAHEYGHTISGIYNHKRGASFNLDLSELESIFIQLIYSDFIKDNFSLNNSNSLNIDYYLLINEYLNSYCFIKSIIKLFKDNNFPAKNKFTKIIQNNLNQQRSMKEVIDECFEFNNEITYIISYLFAIELYNIYIVDKDKALDIFFKIIKLSNDDFRYVEKLLTPNKNLTNYVRSLIK